MHSKYLWVHLAILGITLGASFLESVSYIGFVDKHFILPAYTWYVLSVVTALVYRSANFHIAKWLKLLSWSSILIYIIFTISEVLTYPNYIFTVLHINLQALQIFVLLVSFHWLVSQYYLLNTTLRLAKSLIFSALIFVATEGIGLSIAFLIKGLIPIIKHPNATYEDQLYNTHGGFYPAIQLIIQLTPANSLILIPPQGNPWEVEGNAPIVTYFLYPRQVKNLETTIPETNKPIYALIAKGSWPRTSSVDYGWPKVPINARQIWQFDTTNHTFTTYMRNYSPQTDQWDWGLIEVKHE